ncbi:putative bacteriophage N4 adsorption protein B [Sphingomonas changbaiensis NBRC 104936]|uniref:Putative bacteriophage N4 adsorption protein B n=1 Tax=Sphingomonas changbaiensis NBRC 104936 TaxID=1219043 RepID=A0A0E9MRF5_9SPHN|nr:glycosyl transferase family protein [Sphingomonas changbaiensis]GAO40006.1 putative bacteriophage N4 adsorption protein B [Sphingomonas changbaiensis NBRC 104936]
MGAAEGAVWAIAQATHELALFAAVGIALGGVDDLAIDLIWLARTLWRRLAVYTRHKRADAERLSGRGTVAVFVPAWKEGAVIGPMLETALARWADADCRIYVGCYPNDSETWAAVQHVAAGDAKVRPVLNSRPGPTTKADNLNAVWRALLDDEIDVVAVALHDAEDVVHAAEIGIYAALCGRFDLVQLPVLPLIERGRGWWARAVSSTYADEFAESHGKQLIVREAIGAAVPSAGVGCGFARAALDRIAEAHGAPFDEGSVTEDYELGLRIREMGGRGIFVRLPGRKGGAAVAVRAHFPDTVPAAVRQKARWQAGIALSGWTRLGWRGNLAEHWMRFRDRRAILAALVLLCAYLSGASWAVLNWTGQAPAFGPVEEMLFGLCTGLMLWRLLIRAAFVAHAYGVGEGLRSIPRVLLGNFIAMASARRALQSYLRLARGAPLVWDKTDHRFPKAMPAE